MIQRSRVGATLTNQTPQVGFGFFYVACRPPQPLSASVTP